MVLILSRYLISVYKILNSILNKWIQKVEEVKRTIYIYLYSNVTYIYSMHITLCTPRHWICWTIILLPVVCSYTHIHTHIAPQKLSNKEETQKFMYFVLYRWKELLKSILYCLQDTIIPLDG